MSIAHNQPAELPVNGVGIPEDESGAFGRLRDGAKKGLNAVFEAHATLYPVASEEAAETPKPSKTPLTTRLKDLISKILETAGENNHRNGQVL